MGARTPGFHPRGRLELGPLGSVAAESRGEARRYLEGLGGAELVPGAAGDSSKGQVEGGTAQQRVEVPGEELALHLPEHVAADPAGQHEPCGGQRGESVGSRTPGSSSQQ